MAAENPLVMCLMANPAYENPKCTNISAKSDSKSQEMAHSSEARVAVARQWVHKKSQAAHAFVFISTWEMTYGALGSILIGEEKQTVRVRLIHVNFLLS